MTRDDVLTWARKHLHAGDEPQAFWLGAVRAMTGEFREALCGPAGWIDETSYCEGAREALQRLDPGPPLGRVARHGEIMEEER